MAEQYLRPEDVRPEHARQVLAFLNAATTAEEIGDAVEIADELDVGVRLGERILARREELGGRFTDLTQIRSIPYIGPERFTEIVITLSDARLPGTEVDVAELLREIAALRAEVRALRGGGQAQPRVTLRILQESPYLGQSVDLLVTVTEPDGVRPRVNAPLTLTAPGARLRAVEGTTPVEGETITTRTDGAGMAKVVLLPLLSEELLPAQQDSLEVALRLLSPKASRPREAEEGLREMARRYRWDGNTFFRAAVDVYFRDYGAGLLETVNARDYMVAWRRLEITAQAHLRSGLDGPEGTSVLASAALTVPMRDWLGAWLEMLQVVTVEEARLEEELATVPADQDASLMVGKVYGRVRDFMTAQRGVVGEYVGRRVAESSLRNFVQLGIANLPSEQQLAVFPALDVASRTVAVGGTAMFTAVGQTRVELKKEIDSRITDSIGDIFADGGVLSQVTARLDGFESQLQSKADVAAVSDLRVEMNTRLDQKVDTGVFQTFQRDIDIRFDQRVSLDTFTAFQQETLTRLDTTVARGEFERLSTDVAREVGTIRTNVSRIDRDVLDLRNRG